MPSDKQETPILIESGICPLCGNEIEDYIEVTWDGGITSHSWTCLVCGAKGDECYREEFARHEVRRKGSDKTEVFSAPVRRVIIEVSGGVAHLKEKPIGVEVEIIDYDNNVGP